jgi:pimeloyl-ACP methyl ester carboxylesterase
MPYLRALLESIDDQKKRKEFEDLFALYFETGRVPTQQNIAVALVHGIRTQAVWQGLVSDELRCIEGVRVMAIGYGYINAFCFLFPGPWRTSAYREVVRKLRDIQSQCSGHDIVVIAHSFGTYIVSRILKDDPDIHFARILLCGSIVKRDYRWDQLPGDRSADNVVNDVGCRDGWPVLAKAASWGYGVSGTFGFKDPSRVTDRFHNLAHSDFFTKAHVKTYWLPFFESGEVVRSSYDHERPTPPALMSLLAALPIKMFVVIGIATVVACIRYW